MKYTIQINQLAIIENGFNIKGTNLDTWALLDFLVFFNSAKNHKTLNQNGVSYVWVNYNYIQDNLPLCNLYKQAIKKHLDLLEQIGLIELIKDEANNVYFTFTNLIESLFVDDKNSTHLGKNLPTPRENFTQGVGKILPSTIKINNLEVKNNENLKNLNIKENLNFKRNLDIKKEKNIKKEKKSIFDEALDLYPQDEKLSFSFDDWREWVEYKKARSKNLTILTFKKNLEQLKSFGNLAKEAIDNSISHNWVGLFKPQQNINQNQNNNTNRNFRGGYLEAKDKFANMSNPDHDDSAYDFSLLPSETCGNGS